MSKRRDLVDLPADVSVSQPQVLAKAYRDYYRYNVTLRGEDHRPLAQERDVVAGGKVLVAIPVGVGRQRIVFTHQFRLAACLANGHGDLVEVVAGRVEAG